MFIFVHSKIPSLYNLDICKYLLSICQSLCRDTLESRRQGANKASASSLKNSLEQRTFFEISMCVKEVDSSASLLVCRQIIGKSTWICKVRSPCSHGMWDHGRLEQTRACKWDDQHFRFRKEGRKERWSLNKESSSSKRGWKKIEIAYKGSVLSWWLRW